MSVYQISNNLLSVKVNSFGAELCSIFSKEADIEYIWQADPKLWARHAPNLFPIVGKLKDGTFNYENKTYTLPQHGFARDQEFICVENSKNKLCFELVASEKTLEIFPFHFSLIIEYTLTENKLAVEYKVFNPDNEKLLFSLGAHPAFNCPLQTNETFEDYELHFNEKKSLSINKLNAGLISSETATIELENGSLPLSTKLFETDALVLKNYQVTGVKLISKKTNHGVNLFCQNWPYFGIWTKPSTSKFICLEPWQGIADSITANGDLEEKEGIIALNEGQTFKAALVFDFF